jgi:hypothetical protein
MKLMNAMNLTQAFYDGWNEFSRDPLGTAKELARDYWDAGLAASYGLAWSPHGDQIFGDYQDLVMHAGLFASLVRGSEPNSSKPDDRSYRNFCVWGSVVALGSDMYHHAGLLGEIANKSLNLGALTLAALFDESVIKSRREPSLS